MRNPYTKSPKSKSNASSRRSSRGQAIDQRREGEARRANEEAEIARILAGSDRTQPGSMVPMGTTGVLVPANQATSISGPTPMAETGSPQTQVPNSMTTPTTSNAGQIPSNTASLPLSGESNSEIAQGLSCPASNADQVTDTSMPPPAAQEGKARRGIRIGNCPTPTSAPIGSSQGSTGTTSGTQSTSAPSQVSDNQHSHQSAQPSTESTLPNTQATVPRRLSAASTAAASTKRFREPSGSGEPDNGNSASSSADPSGLSIMIGNMAKGLSKVCNPSSSSTSKKPKHDRPKTDQGDNSGA